MELWGEGGEQKQKGSSGETREEGRMVGGGI